MFKKNDYVRIVLTDREIRNMGVDLGDIFKVEQVFSYGPIIVSPILSDCEDEITIDESMVVLAYRADKNRHSSIRRGSIVKVVKIDEIDQAANINVGDIAAVKYTNSNKVRCIFIQSYTDAKEWLFAKDQVKLINEKGEEI